MSLCVRLPEAVGLGMLSCMYVREKAFLEMEFDFRILDDAGPAGLKL